MGRIDLNTESAPEHDLARAVDLMSAEVYGEHGNVRFVKPAAFGGDDSEAGYDWHVAKATPAAALSGITQGATIFIAPGSYTIPSTLPWPNNVNWVAYGPRDAGAGPLVRLVWGGAANGTMVETDLPATAAFHHGFMDGIYLDGNNVADILVDVRNRFDFMGGWDRCQFIRSALHGIIFRQGATNFFIRNYRFDQIAARAIVAQHDGTIGDLQGVLDTGTFDFNATGARGTGSGQGVILFDYESVAASPAAHLTLRNANIEVNANLEDWVAAQGDTDRALIAVGHNNNYAENGNRINLRLGLDHVHVGGPSGVGNMALVKMSNTADYLVVAMENNVTMGRSGMTAPLRFIDNTTTPFNAIEIDGVHTVPHATFAPFDRDGGTPAGAHTASYFVGDTIFDRLMTRPVPTASLLAPATALDGLIVIEDVAAGDRNLIIYAGGQRFRIDGGAAF